MSTRRYPGEIVRRAPGSCFVGAAEPELVRLTDAGDGELHNVECWGCAICDDADCREWANAQVVTGAYAGDWLCHLSECLMMDLTEADRAALLVLTDEPEEAAGE